MEFENYLADKKIDSADFKMAEPKTWAGFNKVFLQMHPKSFTMQKLNLINAIRRKYPLKEEEQTVGLQDKKSLKPKIKPVKPKTSAKPKIAKPKATGKPVVKRPKIK